MNPLSSSLTPDPSFLVGYAVNGSELKIRSAKLTDVSALADVLAESFHSREGMFAWVYPILRLGIYEDLRTRLTHTPERYLCLVAVVFDPVSAKEQVVGTVEMGLRSRYPWQLSVATRYPYLSNLAVQSQFRRLGLAQHLLTQCEQKAKLWGFSSIYLHVLENNRPARRLYYKLGYRLQEIDLSWDSILFRQPRRLFLRKRLIQ